MIQAVQKDLQCHQQVKLAYGTNGGGYIHNATVANSFSLSSENMILTGPVSVSGTITVDSGSTLVVV